MFDTVLPRVLPMAKYQYHWPGTADLYASQVAAAVSANTDAYTRDALEATTNADLEIILAMQGGEAL